MAPIERTVRLVLVALVGLMLMPAVAAADRPSVGGFVGYFSPVAQDDADADIVYGAKVRLPIRSMLSLEGGFAYNEMGIDEFRVRGQTQEVRSWVVAATTLSLTIGRGFGEIGTHPYVSLGAGYYFLRKDEIPDSDRLGFRGAIGIEFLVREDVSFDLGVTTDRVSVEQGGARAIHSVRIGLNYFLGTL